MTPVPIADGTNAAAGWQGGSRAGRTPRLRLLVLLVAAAVPMIVTDNASAAFVPTATHSLTAPAANAPTDSAFTFELLDDNELSEYVALRPPAAAAIAPGPGGVGFTSATHPALGDIAGSVLREWDVGFLGNPCDLFPIGVPFQLLNATVDNSAGNLIHPSSPGEANSEGRMSPLLKDVNTLSAPPDDNDGGSQGGTTSPANNLPGHTDRYPAYLNTIFDADNGPGVSPVAPLARYSGGQVIAGSAVVFDFAIFDPGAISSFQPPHPLAGAADAWNQGYFAVTVFNGRLPFSTTVTSECTPETYSVSLYGESRNNECVVDIDPGLTCTTSTNGINNPPVGPSTGRDRYRNPVATGTHQWRTWARSTAGSEVSLSQGIAISPGATNVDGEGDGLYDSVDGAWDGTTFWSRSMVTSTNFTDQHLGGTTFGQIVSSSGAYATVDDVAGVEIEYLGASGSMNVSICGLSTLTLTPGDDIIATCPGVTVQVLVGPVTEKFGTITATLLPGTTSTITDLGGGSYQAANSGSSSTSITVGGLTVPPNQVVVVIDGDGDGTVDQVDACPAFASSWVVPAGDTDCDGFTSTNENQVGTNAGLPCAATGGANNEPLPDRWPVDFNDNQAVNTVDVGSYVPSLGSTAPGPPYEIRYDLAFNGLINSVDVGRFVPFLGKSCTPPTTTDSDGDGVPDGTDNCPNWPNAAQNLPPWPVPADDPDCDGFTTTNENQVGTVPTLACHLTTGLNDEGLPDRWPVDFNDSRSVNTIDVGFYVSKLGSTAPGPPYEIRYDLAFNGVINTADVGRFVPFMAKTCTP